MSQNRQIGLEEVMSHRGVDMSMESNLDIFGSQLKSAKMEDNHLCLSTELYLEDFRPEVPDDTPVQTTAIDSSTNTPRKRESLGKSSLTESSQHRFETNRTYEGKDGKAEVPLMIHGGKAHKIKVLKLLRSYYQAVHLAVPPSSASRTSGPRSVASTSSTANTYITTIFSQTDGSYHQELPNKGRTDVENKRRAITRALKACPPCREAQTKCPLEHHMLEELHDITNYNDDLRMIEWAIRTNGSREEEPAPVEKLPSHDASSPYSIGSRVGPSRRPSNVVQSQTIDDLIGGSVAGKSSVSGTSADSSSSILEQSHISMGPPPSTIRERPQPNKPSTSSNKDSKQSLMPPPTTRPRRRSETRRTRPPPPAPQIPSSSTTYSTESIADKIFIGERINGPSAQPCYRCQGIDFNINGPCGIVYSSASELQIHYDHSHLACAPLSEPLRLACRGCPTLHPRYVGLCGLTSQPGCRQSLVERVYGGPLLASLPDTDFSFLESSADPLREFDFDFVLGSQYSHSDFDWFEYPLS